MGALYSIYFVPKCENSDKSTNTGNQNIINIPESETTAGMNQLIRDLDNSINKQAVLSMYIRKYHSKCRVRMEELNLKFKTQNK